MSVETQLSRRPATPADDAFMQVVYASTRADEMALVPWTAEQKAAFLSMQFSAQRISYQNERPAAEYFVIEDSGQPVGRMIVDRSGSMILLMDIAILPEFRNRGLGTALLLELLSEADGSDRPIRLHVEGFNRAIRLYQRLGFVRTGGAGIYFEMIRQPQPAVIGTDRLGATAVIPISRA